MSTTVRWMVPTSYEVEGPSESLIFDLTTELRTILQNKPWETRAIAYGYTDALQHIPPECLVSATCTVLPKKWSGLIEPISNIVGRYLTADNIDNILIEKSGLNQHDGQAIFHVELDIDTETTERGDMRIHPVGYARCKALVDEVSALFRAATHIFFQCDYVIMPTFSENTFGGGLIQIATGDVIEGHVDRTAKFTFPVIFVEADLAQFRNLLQQLSTKWHLNMWPIYRLSKAVSRKYIEMDDFLQLLYAFEGLFGNSTSTDFMKLATQVLLANTRRQANEYRETLDVAFKMRNDCVHGGREYSGMETIRLRSRETISQEVFWPLKRIVSGMILIAFYKLIAHPEMANLRINENDILDKFYAL